MISSLTILFLTKEIAENNITVCHTSARSESGAQSACLPQAGNRQATGRPEDNHQVLIPFNRPDNKLIGNASIFQN
jgi:hypothetical protein